MQAVRNDVSVEHMNAQTLPRMSVDDCAGNAPVIHRLVDIGQYQLIRLRDQVVGIKVLTVNDRGESACVNLRAGNRPVFMAWVAHAITAILLWRADHCLRFDGAVRGNLFDLQIDVARGHGFIPSETQCLSCGSKIFPPTGS